MSIFNNLEENYWRNLITKTILVIFTVAIIVWFLPRNEGRQFRYDVGKPWMYGSVIATFDFPIYKTDEAIKHEQDSLLRQFQPYYTVNSNVGNEQIKRFLHDFSQGIPGLPKEYVELIANQLKQVYQTGIVSTPEYASSAARTPRAFLSVTSTLPLPPMSTFSLMRRYQHSGRFSPAAISTTMWNPTLYMIRNARRQNEQTC